jgi:serine/threonine protein kinase
MNGNPDVGDATRPPSIEGASQQSKTETPSTVAPQSPPVDRDLATIPGFTPQGAGSLARIGRYKVQSELGSGSFGNVYRCRDEQLDRDVAVKLFSGPAASWYGRLDDFLHEAKAAARLRHPGVVAVLDAGRTEAGQGFIVYELVRGATLRERMAAQPPDLEQGVQWVIEIAEALHAAHKCGIVHRDIKPANVLIDEAGKARLTDFGIAKLDDRFVANDAGAVVGTIAYMSPEQAGGQSHWASPQSDIYSLGAVLYELLCRRTPFTGKDFEELRQQVIARAVVPPRTIDDAIPKQLEAICLRALAKKQEERFTTAADMAAALRAVLVPRRRQAMVLKLSAAAAAAGLLAVCLWILWHRPGGGAQPQAATSADDRSGRSPDQNLPAALEDLHNAPFMVRIEVDRPDRTYRGDDVISAKVVSERAGYLYLLYKSADGAISCLFPNKVQQNNRLSAHQEVTIPSPDAAFRIRIGPPYGQEILKAFVLSQPLPAQLWGVHSLTEEDFTRLSEKGLRGALVEVRRRPDWAEHQVMISTLPPEDAPPKE